MKTQKGTRLFLSFLSSISFKYRIGTYETNLNYRIDIQSDVSGVPSIEVPIVCSLDTILDTSLEISYGWLDIVDIINCDVTVLVDVAVLNKDRCGCIIGVDLEQVSISVDFIWAPDHEDPLDI